MKLDKPPLEGVANQYYIFGLWTDLNKILFVVVCGTVKVKMIASKEDKNMIGYVI